MHGYISCCSSVKNNHAAEETKGREDRGSCSNTQEELHQDSHTIR